ncbi:MAG TPA: hypothetical protein VGJ96_10275 [Gemmatimonadaceae bacterium]
MPIDVHRNRHSFVTTMCVAALALAVPQPGIGQGPATKSDSIVPAPATTTDDGWYPEGFVRIRGKRYSLLVGVTYTWFMDGAARVRFGQGTWSPSFELYRPQRRGYAPIFELNDSRIASADSTARIFAVSAGVRYRPVDAERSRALVLYVGVAAGPRVVRLSGFERTTVPGASVQLGVEVLRTARLTVRYEALPTVHRSRLSALTIGTALRLPPYGRRGSRTASRDQPHAATCAAVGCAR